MEPSNIEKMVVLACQHRCTHSIESCCYVMGESLRTVEGRPIIRNRAGGRHPQQADCKQIQYFYLNYRPGRALSNHVIFFTQVVTVPMQRPQGEKKFRFLSRSFDHLSRLVALDGSLFLTMLRNHRVKRQDKSGRVALDGKAAHRHPGELSRHVIQMIKSRPD